MDGLVAVEEVMDLLPDRVCHQVVLNDHVHQIITQSGMKPHKDSEVVLNLLRIIGAWIVVVDVRVQIKPAKDDAEQIPPVPVGALQHIMSDRYKTPDVNTLCGIRRRYHGSRCGGVGCIKDDMSHGGIIDYGHDTVGNGGECVTHANTQSEKKN